MTLVVGFAPDGRGRAVLHLAAMLARSTDDELVVCAVIPSPWPPSPARVDAEYRAYLDGAANSALEQARARLPADIPTKLVVHHARSVPSGLVEVADEHDASLIVVGSASAGGSGYVSLGSATSWLLHSSPASVALAPRGFRSKPDARVERVTAAFGGSEGADELVVAAAAVAGRVGASLRLASFVVRSRPPYTSGVGSSPEKALIEQWKEEIRAAGRAALEQVSGLPTAPTALEAVIGHGETWDEALEDVEWEERDVLVVGSSSSGPIARVFLGSRASRIVRNSPVPVVVVPRAAAAELAEEAVAGT
ncbi:MAG TPA: universal stress protein [Solirubrobacteraceae bacterium]|nr:universal stress protein [Solirubrobacteraceae bacterium]